jgi:hypothetical protein
MSQVAMGVLMEFWVGRARRGGGGGKRQGAEGWDRRLGWSGVRSRNTLLARELGRTAAT